MMQRMRHWLVKSYLETIFLCQHLLLITSFISCPTTSDAGTVTPEDWSSPGYGSQLVCMCVGVWTCGWVGGWVGMGAGVGL